MVTVLSLHGTVLLLGTFPPLHGTVQFSSIDLPYTIFSWYCTLHALYNDDMPCNGSTVFCNGSSVPINGGTVPYNGCTEPCNRRTVLSNNVTLPCNGGMQLYITQSSVLVARYPE